MNETRPTVLLIDDEHDMLDLLVELLEGRGVNAVPTSTLDQARHELESRPFDAVVTDLALSGASGLEVCALAKQAQPGLPVLVVTGYGSMKAAIDAVRAGAYDFITKPVEPDVLSAAVGRAIEHHRVSTQLRELEGKLASMDAPGEFIGTSAIMKRLYDMIMRVRGSPTSVLITGESGVGKELVARAIHAGEDGSRKRPFVAINCAAVPAALLESELFGHAKGAFTDAAGARQGLMQQANGGTLFLDEIGEMDPDMQAKLLRALQERKVRPVGANQEIPIDVRIVAATNLDLEERVEQGQFRDDLYYRLNVVQIDVPPLRQRGNDVLLLAKHFIKEAAERSGRDVRGLTNEAAEVLLRYDWPGNVRQLQNSMDRAVTLTRYEQITPSDLPDKVRSYEPPTVSGGIDVHPEHVLPLHSVERRYIEHVLHLSRGNKSKAARLLGVDRRTLYRKLERYGQADSDEQAADSQSQPPVSGKSPASEVPSRVFG